VALGSVRFPASGGRTSGLLSALASNLALGFGDYRIRRTGGVRMNIGIVSGTTNPRFGSRINHERYADRHSYRYYFDTGPFGPVQDYSFVKNPAITKVLSNHDWIFWIDDDAFFMKFDIKLDSFLEGLDPEVFFVACKSPISPSGQFVFLNAGQYFLRNCPQAFMFLARVHITPLSIVRSWWNKIELGLFTAGDQDAITYILHEHHLLSHAKLMPYQAFNCRPYHYKDRYDEHYLVHFAGVKDKAVAIREFGIKFGLDENTLMPRIVVPTT
jgi:hypothetical protein